MRFKPITIFALVLNALAAASPVWVEASPIEFNAPGVIQKTLKHAARSITYLEWIDSQFNPAPLFEKFRKTLSPDQWNQVCEALKDIPVLDLAYFQEELESPSNFGLASCQKILLERLASYWREARLRMIESAFSFDGPQFPDPLASREQTLDLSTGPELFRGDLKDGEICLTFDDGPHSVHTAEVLEILTSFGVRANFFEVGKNAQELPQISLAVAQANHILGSHSWSHPKLSSLSAEHAKTEISAGRHAVELASQTTTPFFRFPYGERKTVTSLRNWLKEDHFALFYWNMDTLDWKLNDPQVLLKNVLAEIDREKGGIILFHDVHPQTVIVLPEVLRELKRRNFTTVVYIPH
ncbi:MAG: polysaccharide deacetylase family protein [Bdellovibrionota bacterium]